MPQVELIAQGGEGAAQAELEQAVGGLGLEDVHFDRLPEGPGAGADPVQVIVTATLPAAAAAPPGRFDLAREIARETKWEVEPVLDSTIFRPWPSPEGAGTESARWAVDAIGCPTAWKKSTGAGIKVGHPDTGYVAHPELTGPIGPGGYDLVDEDSDPTDVLGGVPPIQFPGHGTGTGSVIASPVGTSSDLAGSAPEATLIPFRVARTVVLFGSSRLLRAIRMARNEKCKVISISLGGLFLGSALRRELDATVAEGRIVVAAAGQPLPFVVEPASYGSAIAVAGSTIERKPWVWTGRGESVDISAPAVDVPRAVAETGGVAGGDGTSFATALTAGVAALWLDHHSAELAAEPETVHARFRSLLEKSAMTPGGWDEDDFGPGILDAAALLELSPAEATLAAPGPEPSRGKRIVKWISRLLEKTEIKPWLDATFDGLPEDAAEEFGTELAFLAAEDEGIRLELREAATRAAAVAPLAPPTKLIERASSSLRQAIA